MKNHQPYLFKKNNTRYLLFTKGGEPHVFSDGQKISFESIFIKNLDNNEEKILFDFPDVIECNPVFFQKNGKNYISYIRSKVLTEDTITDYIPFRDFSLYKVEVDNDFNVIGEHTLIKQYSYSGFENEDLLIYSSYEYRDIMINIEDKSTNKNLKYKITQIVANVPAFRIVPVFGYKNAIIITSAALESSVLIKDIYDLYSFNKLTNKEKRNIYKCSILDNLLVYAIKTGEDFEDRDLVFEEGFDITQYFI